MAHGPVQAATSTGASATSLGGVGTEFWCAPEGFKGVYGVKTDTYSFGILVYEVGRLPTQSLGSTMYRPRHAALLTARCCTPGRC